MVPFHMFSLSVQFIICAFASEDLSLEKVYNEIGRVLFFPPKQWEEN